MWSAMCGDSGSSLRARRTSSGRFGRVSVRSKGSSLGLRSCCSSGAGVSWTSARTAASRRMRLPQAAAGPGAWTSSRARPRASPVALLLARAERNQAAASCPGFRVPFGTQRSGVIGRVPLMGGRSPDKRDDAFGVDLCRAPRESRGRTRPLTVRRIPPEPSQQTLVRRPHQGLRRVRGPRRAPDHPAPRNARRQARPTQAPDVPALRMDLRGSDSKCGAAKWRCPTGECKPASPWVRPAACTR